MEVFGKTISIINNILSIEIEPGTDVRAIQRYGQGLAKVEIDDGRLRTIAQLRKAHALFADIAEDKAITVPEVKDLMRAYYFAKHRKEMPSEAVASVTEQHDFIEITLDFCFIENVPFATKTWDSIREDFGVQFRCLMNRECVICRQHADYCHVETVGAGNNRDHIDHSKHHFMSLCRRHHNRQHDLGIWTFIEREHIKPIKLTDEQCVELGIESKKTMYYFREMEQQLILRGELILEKQGG